MKIETKELRVTIIILIALGSVIVGTVITVLFYFINKDIFNLIGTPFGIVVGAIVTFLIYIVQNRDQEEMSQILERIDLFSKQQRELHRSTIRGSLYSIASDLETLRKELCKFLNLVKEGNYSEVISCMDKVKQTETIERIRNEAESVNKRITDEMYQDIMNVVTKLVPILNGVNIFLPGFCKDINKINKILFIIERVMTEINSLVADPLNPEEFKEISFSSVLNKPKECIIVVGERATTDHESARRLQTALHIKCEIRLDTKINDDKKKNLILIGGPSVNKVTKEISNELPIQYASIQGSGSLFSRISNRIYSGDTYASLQAIPSSFVKNAKKKRTIIVVFGMEDVGTAAAACVLIDKGLIEESDKKFLRNRTKSNYLAKVIIKKDDNPPYDFSEDD